MGAGVAAFSRSPCRLVYRQAVPCASRSGQRRLLDQQGGRRAAGPAAADVALYGVADDVRGGVLVPGFVMYADRVSLAAAAGASLLGYGIYVAYALVGAHPGAQTGQTLTLLTHAVFGRAGSWLVSLLVMIPALGWVGFQAGVLAQLWHGFYEWGTWRSSRSWWPR